MPPAGTWRCTLYVLYYGLEYFLGRAWLWWAARVRNRIIVFDRYWHEFFFQRRYLNCPRVALRLLELTAAKPDALVFLDVAPEVAFERRREQPLEEIRRLHGLCAEVVARTPNGYALPVTTVEESVRRLEQIVVERMARIAQSRLRGPRR